MLKGIPYISGLNYTYLLSNKKKNLTLQIVLYGLSYVLGFCLKVTLLGIKYWSTLTGKT